MIKNYVSEKILYQRIKKAPKANLAQYLKESCIPCKSKDKKDDLLAKVFLNLRSEFDMERLSKYIYLTSMDVQEILEISPEEMTRLVKSRRLIVDGHYRSNYGQGKGYLFRADKVMDYIDPSRPLKNRQPLNDHPSMAPWEFSRVTGRPLPEVLHDMRDGSIPYEWIDGDRRIPFSYLYPTLYK